MRRFAYDLTVHEAFEPRRTQRFGTRDEAVARAKALSAPGRRFTFELVELLDRAELPGLDLILPAPGPSPIGDRVIVAVLVACEDPGPKAPK